jgi:HEAT repeat protein
MSPSSTDADFSTALRSDVMSQRGAALQRLIGSQLSEQATEMIEAALADRDALVRRRAAELLRALEYSSQAERFLIRMADDPSWVVREAAVESIERHVTRERGELISVLIGRSLHDRRRVVRERALHHVRDHLASFDNADSLFEEYIRTAKDRRFAVRCRAVEGLSALYEQFPQGIDTLIECADDSHHKVRRVVVMHAPQRGELARRLIPVLVKRWFDQNESIGRAAEDALKMHCYEMDDLLGLCLSIVLKNIDSESRLGALLEIPELDLRLGDDLRAICQRRSAWARRVGPAGIEPVEIAGPTLDEQVSRTIKVVASMSNEHSEKRQRQQQIWFIRQIIQLLSDGAATSANQTD